MKLGALLLALLCGCATAPRGPAEVYLGEEHGGSFQGLRAAQADLLDGNKRLDMFLGVPAEVGEGEEARFAEVIYAVARNEGEDPLQDAERLINHEQQITTKPITIWCEAPTETYLLKGVDCDAKAIKVWHPKASKYVIIDLDYTMTPWRRENIRWLLKEGGGQVYKIGRKATGL